DTNLLIYARVAGSPAHQRGSEFLSHLWNRSDVVIAELVLVEFYLALRNPAILSPPLDATAAVAQCDHLRKHPRWRLVENADIMEDVWTKVAQSGFARRRIIDVRLALTLRAHGVTEF